MKKLAHDEKGSLYFLTFIFLLLICIIAAVVIEYLRVNDLREHVEDEIYRASNLGIKAAMYDNYRIIATSRFDENVAVSEFYRYLKEDLGTTDSFVKNDSEGKFMYRISFNSVSVDGVNVRMHIKATVSAKPMFALWNESWAIPIDIMSRNIRTDV